MEGWMDENFVKNVFQTVLGEAVQVKVIRDRNSGYVKHKSPFLLSLIQLLTILEMPVIALSSSTPPRLLRRPFH